MPTTRETDILVIGGGAAGMYAALTAHRHGVSCLLVSKGPIGRSGGSIFAGSLVADLAPEWVGGKEKGGSSTPGGDEYSTGSSGVEYYYLTDRDHLTVANSHIRDEIMPELERLGLYIPRQPDGTVLHTPGRGASTWTPKMGLSGRAIADLLRRRVLDADIPVIEEAMVTSLMVADGKCVGATILRFTDGEFLVVNSKATILATGHANYLSKRSTATREVCGDGIAIPYEAGAELFNIEIQLWHASDMASPSIWCHAHMYPNPLPLTEKTSRLVTKDGELIFEQETMAPARNAPYDLQMRNLYKFVKSGRASYEGGYYTDLRHIDSQILDGYVAQIEFVRKVGLDPAKDLIENAPSYHYICGGVHVNRRSMASEAVPGLFAAGAAAGTDGQTCCAYEGKVAAESAIGFATQRGLERPNASSLQREEERISSLLETAGKKGITPVLIKSKIREIMWDKMGFVKDESRMLAALQELKRVRETMLPQIALPTGTKRFNYDLVDALDVHNMFVACEVQIRASLHRKESRGPFFREDYPYIDNKNWLKFVIVSRGADDDVRIRTEPVRLDVSLPERVDYLTAGW